VAIAALGVAAAGVNTASNALVVDLFPGDRARRHEPSGDPGRHRRTDDADGHSPGVSGGLMANEVVVSGGVMGCVGGTGVCVGAARDIADLVSAFERGKRFGALPASLASVWLCAALLLGGGNEAAMAGWISTYLQAAGSVPRPRRGCWPRYWLV
jgi:hypothetical protein